MEFKFTVELREAVRAGPVFLAWRRREVILVTDVMMLGFESGSLGWVWEKR